MSYNWQQPHYRQGRKAPRKITREKRGSLDLGPEDCVQHDYFHWVDMFKGKHRALHLVFAIPNSAGQKSRMVRAVQWATGLRPGVPDVFIAHESDDRHRGPRHIGFFIEFKSATGSVSKEQREWHERLRAAGYRVEVHRSWITAANATIEYLGLPIPAISE